MSAGGFVCDSRRFAKIPSPRIRPRADDPDDPVGKEPNVHSGASLVPFPFPPHPTPSHRHAARPARAPLPPARPRPRRWPALPAPSGLMRAQYNGLTPTSRSYLHDPCCVRFERRISFAHGLVGTVICSACGVLPKFWNTYLGHIGPASVMFIISELVSCPGPNTVVTPRGWTCVLGGLGYLTYDHPSSAGATWTCRATA